MIVAIMIMSILMVINTFLTLLIMLSIYGKCNDVIERQENIRNAIVDIFKGLANGINSKRK